MLRAETDENNQHGDNAGFLVVYQMLTAHTRVNLRHVCHRPSYSSITHKPTKQLNK
jgi:hypothetical protein